MIAADASDLLEPQLADEHLHSVLPVLLEHASAQGWLTYPVLAKCAAVGRPWYTAAIGAMTALRCLDFNVSEPNVVLDCWDDVVLHLLSRVAGSCSTNLRVIDLRACKPMTTCGIEQLLDSVYNVCTGIVEIDVTGFDDCLVIHGTAVCSRQKLGCSTPAALHSTLRSFNDGKRVDYAELCCWLCDGPGPHLVCQNQLMPSEASLRSAVERGAAWDVALLLGVVFSRHCMKFSEQTNRQESHLTQREFHADSFPALHVVLEDLSSARDSSKRSGRSMVGLEMVRVLIQGNANVNAANCRGQTPLMEACSASSRSGAGSGGGGAGEECPDIDATGDGGRAVLVQLLVEHGANVHAVRLDGASALALAIGAGAEERLVRILRTCTRPEDTHQSLDPFCRDRGHDLSVFERLVRGFLEPEALQVWLLAGASPRGLAGEIGALLSLSDQTVGGVDVKERLRHVRAFLERHRVLLSDVHRWPVTHTVQQLASQEPNGVFGCAGSFRGMVEWLNKAEMPHACRWVLEAGVQVASVSCGKKAGGDVGHWVARAQRAEVVVCDAETGFERQRLRGHGGWVGVVLFAPGPGELLASGSEDTTVRLWLGQPNRGHCGGLEHAQCGREFCLAGLCEGHLGAVLTLTFVHDGRLLASAGSDQTIRVWDCAENLGGQALCVLRGHTDWVTCLSFAAPSLLLSGSHDRSIRLWMLPAALTADQLTTISCCCTAHGASGCVNSVCFSSDVRHAASATDDTVTGKNLVLVWTVTADSRALVLKHKLMGHASFVRAVAFSPRDPRVLISGSDDRSIKIWDASSGQLQRTLGAGAPVRQVAFVNDFLLLSSSLDGSSRFWLLPPQYQESMRMVAVTTDRPNRTIGGGKYRVQAQSGLLVTFQPTGTGSWSNGARSVSMGPNQGQAPIAVPSLHRGDRDPLPQPHLAAFFLAPSRVVALKETGKKAHSSQGSSREVDTLEHASQVFSREVGPLVVRAGETLEAHCDDGSVLLLRAPPPS